MWRKLPISSLTPFTFQDFPDHTACILWFFGCNMRCGYCHNPELVIGRAKRIDAAYLERFLKARQGLLEGVVLSGGECTLSAGLPAFARYLKSLGYKVKVDTNGTRPEVLRQLIDDGLVDFISLDFKAPPKTFASITGLKGRNGFLESLEIIAGAAIGKEVRTTVHPDQLDRADLDEILNLLAGVGYHGSYVVQNFKGGSTLGNLADSTRKLDLVGLNGNGIDISFRNFSSVIV
jgi:pyruvate formate lyase activating enzyme